MPPKMLPLPLLPLQLLLLLLFLLLILFLLLVLRVCGDAFTIPFCALQQIDFVLTSVTAQATT